MSESRPEHDEVLVRILSGELDVESPEAQRWLEGAEGRREELEGLRALEGQVRAIGQREAEVLEQARRMDADADEDRMMARLRESCGPASPASSHSVSGSGETASGSGAGPRLSWWWLGLAAAGVVAVTFALLRRGAADEDGTRDASVAGGGTTDEAPVFLSGESGGCRPAGEVAVYDDFSWDFELPANGSFELSIYDATGTDDAGSDATPLWREEAWMQSSWRYDAARHPRLPARIRWQVLVLDDAGFPIGQGCGAEVWLRP